MRAPVMFALLSQLAAASPATGQLCSTVKEAIQSKNEEQSASSYCASYFGDSAARTKTITKTITTFVSTTTKTKTEGSTITKSSEVLFFPSASATKTLFTSTSTIYTPLTSCAAPSSVQKQLEVEKPAAFAAIPVSSLSEACRCLSPDVEAKIGAKTTKTITKTATRTVHKTVHPMTTELSTLTFNTQTSYSTVDDYTTTVTVTAISPFKLLDSSSNKYAASPDFDKSNFAFVKFDEDEEDAGEWSLQQGDLYYKSFSASAFSFSSGAYVSFNDEKTIGGVACSFNRNNNGSCIFNCAWSGGDLNAVDEHGNWYLGGVEEFSVYAIGVTS